MKVVTPETKVGLLTIVAIALLLLFSMKVGGLSLFGDSKSRYIIMHFSSVAGLEVKSKVKLSGVEIGYVDELTLEEGYASVKAVLTHKALIRKGSIATISSAGLLGESYIEIIQGSQDQAPLGNGEILNDTRSAVDVSAMVRKLSTALDDVNAMTSSLRQLFDSMEKWPSISGIIGNIEKATANLKSITGKIKRGEGTVGKLVTDEEVYENLNKTLAGAGKILDKTDDLGLDLGFRAEWQAYSSSSKGVFTLRLRPRENKYYLLEVTEDIRKEWKDGERHNTLESLLYTAQIARRFSDFVVRGGLTESSVGVGLEYYMLNDSLIAVTDVYNMKGYDNNAENPQLKVSLKWTSHNYLFAYFGGDELLNEYYRTFFLGGGILFDEDDLKMVIGLLY